MRHFLEPVCCQSTQPCTSPIFSKWSMQSKESNSTGNFESHLKFPELIHLRRKWPQSFLQSSNSKCTVRCSSFTFLPFLAFLPFRLPFLPFLPFPFLFPSLPSFFLPFSFLFPSSFLPVSFLFPFFFLPFSFLFPSFFLPFSFLFPSSLLPISFLLPSFLPSFLPSLLHFTSLHFTSLHFSFLPLT